MKKIYNLLYREVCLSKKADIAMRPMMSAINHHNGYLEATDSHILAKIPYKYSEDLEGKPLNKLGEEIEGCFPNVDSVIPGLNRISKLDIDLFKFEEAVTNISKLKFKEGKGTTFPYLDVIDNSEFCFSVPYLATLIKLFKELKTNYGIHVNNGSTPSIIFLAEDYLIEDVYTTCLLMPVMSGAGTERYFTLETALAYEKPKPQPKKAWYE